MNKWILLVIVLTFISCQEESINEMELEAVSTEETDTVMDPMDGSVECVGEIALPPEGRVDLHARTSGYIRSIHALEGDRVKKGQSLAVIESPEFAVWQNELIQFHATLQQSEDEWKRVESLQDNTSMSQKEREQIRYKWLRDKANFNGASKRLEAMGFSSQLILAGDISNALEIRSPMTGVVTKVEVNAGAYVKESDHLFSVIDVSHMHIHMNVPSQYAGRIKKGMSFSMKGYQESDTIKGVVVLINAELDPASHTFTVHGHALKDEDMMGRMVGEKVFVRFNEKDSLLEESNGLHHRNLGGGR